MHKFPVAQYKNFEELPLDQINKLNFSVYLIDFGWNYLFVNNFVRKNLGERADGLIGRNMWEAFPELAADPTFTQLRQNMERNVPTNLITVSPVTSQRINISGFRLEDCYYFILGSARQDGIAP